MIKRLFDICFSTLILVATLPILIICIIAIKRTSDGPIFYAARRAGKNGKPFNMYKLRTMRVNTDAIEQRVTAENDNRITPIGKLLRSCKLDELPQFWNVLRGDMSIVGPRPEDWEIVVRHYTVPYREALAIRPGIASPADVLWYPDQTYHDPPPPGVPIQEYYIERHLPIKLIDEIDYVNNYGVWTDLKVIAQTAFCILYYSLRQPKKRQAPMVEAFGDD